MYWWKVYTKKQNFQMYSQLVQLLRTGKFRLTGAQRSKQCGTVRWTGQYKQTGAQRSKQCDTVRWTGQYNQTAAQRSKRCGTVRWTGQYKQTAAQRSKRCGTVHSTPLDRTVQNVQQVLFQVFIRIRWLQVRRGGG